jgi:hypothetical protein
MQRDVRRHWPGGGDIVALADSIASVAPIYSPNVFHVCFSSKVELGSAAGVLKGIGKNQEPLVGRDTPDRNRKDQGRLKVENDELTCKALSFWIL